MVESTQPSDLQKLAQTRILIVGDLILDHYVRGTTDRTSPEAPVPVVLFGGEEVIPGGAANVARNVRAASAQAFCVGVVGDDRSGEELITALGHMDIDCSFIVRDKGRPTTTKTRIISQGQQMLRLDREDARPVPGPVQAEVVAAVRKLLGSVQAVVVSDYAKGVLTPSVLSEVIAAAKQAGVPLFVDPKGRDFTRYQNAFGLTPNAREAFEASGVPTRDEEGLLKAAEIIFHDTNCEMLTITRGPEGVAVFSRIPEAEQLEVSLIPTAAREVFDVTGAGDTFVAFLAMATAASFSGMEAARIANAAAGVVVGKSGAATLSLFELRAALAPAAPARKLRSPDELADLGDELRRAGKKIVFTNGCFDFIHAGHVAFLQQARALGDVLVLATNTDDVIKRLKGDPRPIIKQGQREELLAAIEAVNFIVPFSDETPHDLIRLLKPDVLVKGNNYTQEQVEGHEIVESYGGKIALLDIVEHISTRELLGGKRP